VKPPKPPYPSIVALAALLRADDDKAVAYVIAELRFAGGNVSATAKRIGCSLRAVYSWRDSNKRLKAAFDAFALGRSGASTIATAAADVARKEREAANRKAKRKKKP